MKKIISLLTAAAMSASLFAAVSVSAEGIGAEETGADFVIADTAGAADIYVDPNGSEYDGLSLIAEALQSDIELVTGTVPDIVEDPGELGGTAVIAGVVGENEDGLLNTLIEEGKIDVSEIEGGWEQYKIQLVDDPADNVEKAVVIAGSDKRGAIYGMFHISELMGVSPWVWYGDVTPEHMDEVSFSRDELEITSKEPSVKYRGVFLNDESPSLTGWAAEKYGGLNYKFYRDLYECLLRLKANYLWPAMWGERFSTYGLRGLSENDYPYDYPHSYEGLQNADLADKYGIVMGTSHHEPMLRANAEWGDNYKDYIKDSYPDETFPVGTNSTTYWNFQKYPDALTKYWTDSAVRNGGFENVATIGMRSNDDAALEGTMGENVKNLKDVISVQKQIISESVSPDMPTCLVLYKEVEDYWYGGTDDDGVTHVEGLNTWDTLDGTTIMLCDDNYGNVRTLPKEEERDRNGGWGMYYHFDYVGAPNTYKWVATNQLEKTWENMTAAYEYGVREIWVVNVGDFKPMELNTSYFIDLAYDYDKWSGANLTDEYTDLWTEQQFGGRVSEDDVNNISQLLSDYLKLNGARKPEKMFRNTMSLTDYNEAQRVLRNAQSIYDRAYGYYENIPDELKDAYYQLVLYPAAASANITMMCIYSGLNKLYKDSGSVLANTYAALTDECVRRDEDMMTYYNKTMSGGKWNKMQGEKIHVGYTSWDASTYEQPEGDYLTPAAEDALVVNIDGSSSACRADGNSLPVFTSTNRETYAVTVSHKGSGAFDYTAEADKDWIRLDKTSGTVNTGDVIGVSIDWSKVTSDSTGTITVSALGETVSITVNAKAVETAELPEKTYIGKDGVTSILASNYSGISNEEDWIVIDNYGREASSVKARDITADFSSETAPWLEYSLYVPNAGEYTLTAYMSPANPRYRGGRIYYGISVNGGGTQEIPSLIEKFDVGGYAGGVGTWANGVIDNAHITSSKIQLEEGENTIRFLSLDSGAVLQKLVVSENTSLGSSCFGAPESYYIGSGNTDGGLIHFAPEDRIIVPGRVDAAEQGETRIIVSDSCSYIITAEGEFSEDAQLSIKLNGEEAAVLSDNGEGMYGECELEEGEYVITYDVTAGTAEMRSLLFTANDERIKNEIINDDFSDSSQLERYETYLEDAGTFSLSNGTAEVKFKEAYSSNNGIKTDVTDLVKGASGMEFGAAADVRITYDCTAKIFLEIVSPNGTVKKVDIASSNEFDENKNISLSGEVEKVEFQSSDKVYLCITQSSGQAFFDNIRLWFYMGKVTEEFFTHDFSDEAQGELYSVYDETRAPKAFGVSGGALNVDYDEDWNGTNGVKIDVTEYVSGHSGGEFKASADLTSWFYGESNVEIFFEAAASDGSSTKTVIASRSGSDLGAGEKMENINGETVLEFGDTDRVYLCITHPSGKHVIDNVSLTGTYMNMPDDTKTYLFEHSFNAYKNDEAGMYEPYEAAGGVVSPGNSPVLKYENVTAQTSGIRIDLTDKFGLNPELSGLTFGARTMIKPGYTWSGSSNVKIFFEVISGGDVRTVALGEATPENSSAANGTDPDTGADLGTNWLTEPVSGESVLEFGENDTVYLCITSDQNQLWLDDIAVYYIKDTSGDDDPTPPVSKEFTVSEPVMDGSETASVTVTNTTDESRVIVIYLARYNDDGTLRGLTRIDRTSEANSGTQKIEFSASAGDTVFVWDDGMRPYTQAVELSAAE